jgi:hypothetical protein
MHKSANAPASWGQSLLILFLMCVGLPTPVMGQSAVKPDDHQPDFPGLDIQAVVGWDGRVETDAPVPVSFLISNQSSQVLEGQLILSEPETEREINLGDVFVGPGSVRRFSSVLALSDWSDCVATYTDGSTDFWTRQLPLMTGKDFSEDVNYLLFVDDGGRALQLPAVETPVASGSPQSETTAPKPTGAVEDRFLPRFGFGRSVQPVSVKSWQVPQHPGPLTVAQAMLFSETVKVEMLNDPQWDAIGHWVCLGGTVFVHESSKEVLERLKKAAPLRSQPAVLQDEHQTYRCGAGSIREYNGRLFSADESRAVETVLEASSRLSRYSAVSIPDQLPLTYVGTSNASFTRLMVLAVFSIYLLFSGVVALLMFRSNRRRVMTYTVSVVTIACVAAALLGSYLRNSRGDLLWRSVIVGGPGGAVQIAQIRVQSAGGRNTQVAVRGKKADLQLLRKKSTDRSDYYSRFAVYNLGQTEGAVGYAPFSVQPNLLKDEPEAFRIGVPITPWGVRQSIAAAYDPELQGVQIDLRFRPEGSVTLDKNMNNGDSWTYVVPGQWNVSVTNRLPFDLTECQLLVTTSVPHVPSSMMTASGVQFSPGRGEIRLGEIAATASTTTSLSGIPFVVTMTHYWYNSQNTIEPEPAFPGASDIWFIARVNQSPLLTIDDEHSDFEQFDGLHYYIQKLTPDEIPQEWRDTSQQCLEQQMSTAQEILKQQKTQEPEIPQF